MMVVKLATLGFWRGTSSRRRSVGSDELVRGGQKTSRRRRTDIVSRIDSAVLIDDMGDTHVYDYFNDRKPCLPRRIKNRQCQKTQHPFSKRGL
ncbi:unnamed protein product [Caenorhabditis auriculariae]|uniref:Uncharacterized protein n=1 Tax=Caenorhabditis auriculariae TaxID=2777116 RepID=A0A8S1H3F6_9PELO|nr:unnamed protein product [Caenorhabditis auriculariae]